MSLIEIDARARAEEIRALRARIALGVKMLTTGGYAMIGGTFFKAVSEQRPVTLASYVWAVVGVVALVYALLLAPHGASQND